MGKNKQKSAKDVAFERERVRLQSAIRHKDEEITSLRQEVASYKTQAESWEKTAHLLEKYIGIPKDKLLADMKRNEQIAKALSPIGAIAVAGKKYMHQGD